MCALLCVVEYHINQSGSADLEVNLARTVFFVCVSAFSGVGIDYTQIYMLFVIVDVSNCICLLTHIVAG